MVEDENRAPGVIWSLRRPGVHPNAWVRTADFDLIAIQHYSSPGDPGAVLLLSRKDARLLAKRINQCLDGTKKR